MHSVINAIGYTAASINVVILLPQVIKTVRTKKTRDLSKLTFSLMDTAAILWLIYGMSTKSLPLIMANGFTVFFASTLLIMKHRHG